MAQAWTRLALGIALATAAAHASAESVFVKYRGNVNLTHFQCQPITDSSVVRDVCYDAKNQYMLISLRGTFYHYCGVPGATVQALITAPSKGSYYNAVFKGNFDCRVIPPPSYNE